MITDIVVLSIIAVVLFLVWLLFDVENVVININIPSTIVSIIAIVVVLLVIMFIF